MVKTLKDKDEQKLWDQWQAFNVEMKKLWNNSFDQYKKHTQELEKRDKEIAYRIRRIPRIIKVTLWMLEDKFKKDKENFLIVVKKITKFFRNEMTELKSYAIKRIENRN